MTTTDEYLANLIPLVGIVERPAHSNQTIIGENFGWNGVAWCAETQSVVALDTFGKKVLWTASVAEAINLAEQGHEGMQLMPRDVHINVCDLSCFDFGGKGNPADFHISCVVNPGTQDKFETIGGNEGDAVRRQWRDRKYITHFIRLPFTQIGYGSEPSEGELVGTVADMVQAIDNAVFGDPSTPGSGLQDRVAQIEADVKKVLDAIGDDKTGVIGSSHADRRLAKAVLRKLGLTDEEILAIEQGK